MSRRRPRGFALVIVVICSVAMVAIAIAVAFTAGANKIVSVKGSSIDRAETIAVAGMERAVAYAEAAAVIERDFDLLLDPNLDVDCVAQARNATAIGARGLPRFTDPGASNAVVDGRTYRVVPFNGGAYLVRFDDDADDVVDNVSYASFSGNHNATGSCAEGPTFSGGNNPFRDRNRAVWVSVLGIYPGTDPAHANHRVALTRYHISTQRLPSLGFVTRDGLSTNNRLTFCSEIADISVGGAANMNGGDICGAVLVDGSANITGSLSTTAPAACVPAGSGGRGGCSGSASVSAGVPQSTLIDGIITATTQSSGARERWFDAARPGCNLVEMDITGLSLIVGTQTVSRVSGLFFRDARSDCATSTDLSPPTALNFLTTSCWAPLLVKGFAGTTSLGALDICDWDEVSGANWVPEPGSPTGGGLCLHRKKPDFTQCRSSWPDNPTVTVGCTQCNGSETAISFNGSHPAINLNKPQAMPAVTLQLNGWVSDGSSNAPTSYAPTQWGLATVILHSGLSLNGSEALAFGTARPAFQTGIGPAGLPALHPSLVVLGNLSLSGTARVQTAGGLMAQQVTLAGDASLITHGAVIVGGNVNAGTSNTLEVHVLRDPLDLGNDDLRAAPTTSRSLR